MSKEQSTQENTLYLPIKQVYFDAIVAGTKKTEEREIKEGITANRYLEKDAKGDYVINTDVADPSGQYFIDDYNEGKFPFKPKQYKYLSLAVGYAKERDTALVEVVGFSFEPHMIRYDRDNNPCYAFWVIKFHIGEVVEVHRKAPAAEAEQKPKGEPKPLVPSPYPDAKVQDIRAKEFDRIAKGKSNEIIIDITPDNIGEYFVLNEEGLATDTLEREHIELVASGGRRLVATITKRDFVHFLDENGEQAYRLYKGVEYEDIGIIYELADVRVL